MSTSKVMNINLWNIPGKFEFVSNDRTLNLSTTSILLRTETHAKRWKGIGHITVRDRNYLWAREAFASYSVGTKKNLDLFMKVFCA
jgi:hypothetical protein